ncbi:MAG TPA: SDR family oxidoreductase [Phycisphaerales bacterium]|nr:SDR family oxidoreductase [Phycisphaerales bacterium]
MKLKKLDQQVIVITGGTSGIGLVTARLAAKKGAKLVIAARNEQALRELQDELASSGTDAVCVLADVANEHEVERIAATATEAYGGFDTWINNAGVSVYGRLEDVPAEDHRRLFETNFWGLVYGSLTAAKLLKQRGGAIINIGSVLSDRAIPLQGMYSASKHAVKGFTDALRMELEEEGSPVSVTLIKPSAIDTPYTKHAKNYMDSEPKNPAPVYAPEVVARTILYCCENPQRDVTVGAGGKILSTIGAVAPRLTDKVMEGMFFQGQKRSEPNRGDQDSLHEPSGRDLEERGEYPGHVSESSLYTAMRLHPLMASVAVLGAALAVTAVVFGATGRGPMRGRTLRTPDLRRGVPRAFTRVAKTYNRAGQPVARGIRTAAKKAPSARAAFEEWVSARPFKR